MTIVGSIILVPWVTTIDSFHCVCTVALKQSSIFSFFTRDLAVDLRMKLGDWFRVVQLLKTGGGAGLSG